MADQILDGSGKGYRARVNSKNQLGVIATAVSMQHYSAHALDGFYSLVLQQTPTAPGDVFSYIKNTHNVDLNLWEIVLYCPSAEAVEIWEVAGDPVSGSAYNPPNVIVGNGATLQATVLVGNGISGLAKRKLLKRLRVEAGKPIRYVFDSAIIIPENNAIAFCAVVGGILVEANASIDAHPEL